MKRRDFLKSAIVSTAAVAAPSAVVAKPEGDGLLRVTGENGEAVVDYRNKIITVIRLIEGDRLYSEAMDAIDQIYPPATNPMFKQSPGVYRIAEDWLVPDRRQIIDCSIVGELQISLLGNHNAFAEIYINGNAIHSDFSADILYVNSDGILCVRPLINYPPGSSLKVVAVSEHHASTFDAEIVNERDVYVALSV